MDISIFDKIIIKEIPEKSSFNVSSNIGGEGSGGSRVFCGAREISRYVMCQKFLKFNEIRKKDLPM